MGKSNYRNIVDADFVLNLGDVYGVRFAEIHHVLHTGIKNDTVDIRMLLDDTTHNMWMVSMIGQSASS